MSSVAVYARIPQIKDLETAIRLYYERVELSSADVIAIFGCSRSTATRLKQAAKRQMITDGVPAWNATNVNTEAAFTAWGLSISDLEARLAKLRRLKLYHKEVG